MPSPTPTKQTETRRPVAGRPPARLAMRWIERAFALFGALVAVYWLTLDISVVVSQSMFPTLQGNSLKDGDRVVTEKVSRWFRKPRRWEVITFTTADGEKRMKRVAAFPGESVQMLKTGEFLVDGQPLEVPSSLTNRNFLRFGNLMDGNPVSCGDGYYVLGDELKDSDDSRFNGPVPANQILGRTWLIVWPFTRFGFVN